MIRSLVIVACLATSFGFAQSTRSLPRAQFAALGDTLHVPDVPGARVAGALVGDLDGSGPPDLLRWGDAGLEMLRGLGDGRFAVGAVLAPAPVFLAALADVDGDGDLDILCLVRDPLLNRLRLLRNQGSGAFALDAPAVAAVTVQPYERLAVADFDGDGDDDVATIDANRWAILSLDAAGVLRPRYLAGATFARPIALLDVDGDADPDWIQVRGDGRAVEVLANDGTGNFSSSANVALPAGTTVISSCVDDVDGNGVADIVLAIREQTALGLRFGLALLAGDGRGSFSPGVVAGPLPSAPSGVATADVDFDGRVEYAVDFGGGRGSRVYETFFSSLLDVTRTHLPASSSISRPSFADVDGDGDPDLLALRRDAVLDAYLNDGLGLLQPLLRPEVANPLVAGAVPLDVDADGNPDLVNGWGDAILMGRPAGTAVQNGRFAGVTGATPLVADFDRDGNADVFFAQDRAVAFEGGTWRPFPALPQPAGRVRGAAVGEFDGDSIADIALVTDTGLEVWLGDGRGGFAVRTTPLVFGGSVLRRWVAEDLDRDGDADLIGADATGPLALQNDGTGRFVDASAAVFPGRSGAVADLLMVDLNRNGIDEVVAVPLLQSSLEIWVNVGTAYQRRAVPVGSQPISSLGASDVDLDGDIDLVVSTAAGLALLVNDGTGGLMPASGARSLSIREFAFVLIDVDGDGDDDIYAAATYHNTHRQVRVPYHPALGGSLEVDLWAGPSYGGQVFAATLVGSEILAAPLPTVEGSPLIVNPNSASILPIVTVPGATTQSLTLPVRAALAGQAFAVQTLFLQPGDLRLGNAALGYVLR